MLTPLLILTLKQNRLLSERVDWAFQEGVPDAVWQPCQVGNYATCAFRTAEQALEAAEREALMFRPGVFSARISKLTPRVGILRRVSGRRRQGECGWYVTEAWADQSDIQGLWFCSIRTVSIESDQEGWTKRVESIRWDHGGPPPELAEREAD